MAANCCDELLGFHRRQTVEPLEVIVVDNGSTDGAPEVACAPGARVIAMGRNAGFAAAVNRGIRGGQRRRHRADQFRRRTRPPLARNALGAASRDVRFRDRQDPAGRTRRIPWTERTT